MIKLLPIRKNIKWLQNKWLAGFVVAMIMLVLSGALPMTAVGASTVESESSDDSTQAAHRSYLQKADWLWDEIPNPPVLHPSSGRWVSMLASGSHSVSLHDYGATIVTPDEVTASTPRFDIEMTAGWGDPFTGAMPIPSDTVVPPMVTTYGDTGDAHLSVADPATNLVYSLWQAAPQTNPRSASYGGLAYLDGDGREFSGSSTASKLSRYAGVIRLDELRQAIYDNTDLGHTLFFASSYAGPDFVYPAQKSDGSQEDGLPEGARVQLDPSIDIDVIDGILAYEKAIAKTLQKYGAVLGDKSGAGMNFIFEYQCDDNPGAAYKELGLYDYADMTNIPWSSLRVLNTWNGK